MVEVNGFSKMMMAAGADSPSTVATQSAKTDILQKIGQAGNNHQNLELQLEPEEKEEKESNTETQNENEETVRTPALGLPSAASALEVRNKVFIRDRSHARLET